MQFVDPKILFHNFRMVFRWSNVILDSMMLINRRRKLITE
jgi:hypothetical protein